MEGPSQDVVKAYERYIRELEDRRLQAKNRKAGSAKYDAFDRDTYTDTLVGTLELAPGSATDICESACCAMERSKIRSKSATRRTRTRFRPVQSCSTAATGRHRTNKTAGTTGRFGPAKVARRRSFGSTFGSTTRRRCTKWRFHTARTKLVNRVPLQRGGGHESSASLPTASDWTEHAVPLTYAAGAAEKRDERMSRWPGVRGLAIADEKMTDGLGKEQTVFEVHQDMSVLVEAVAVESGQFPLVPAALIFRLDGIVATRHVGERVELNLDEGDHISLRLDLGSSLLGDVH